MRLKTEKPSKATKHSLLQAITLPDSQGNCIPSPNQPLAKLDHKRKQLDEPRIDPKEAAAIEEVACDFHGRPDAHFPHVMQQLYRCFSYWQDYHTKMPYLLMPTGKVESRLSDHPFVSGVLDMFEFQMDVGIIMKNVFDQRHSTIWLQCHMSICRHSIRWATTASVMHYTFITMPRRSSTLRIKVLKPASIKSLG